MHSPSDSKRPVTVSVVSHGQWALLEPLLVQLGRWCGPSIERVVLTINRPEAVAVPADLPFEVLRLDNSQPRGFGDNHNRAFSHCATPWFLVLNPDIRIPGRDVVRELLARPALGTGLLAPRIQEPNKCAPEPYRRALSPWELLARRLPGHQAPTAPAWVPGMFMLLRREAFAQVGGFDQRFFMYCEDFDLCARLRLAGWELQIGPEAVEHMAQRASQSALRPLTWHLLSLLKLWSAPAYWQYLALLRRQRPSHEG
jgi:N-acetylglucosaminyl-diphospho-decaprenol L-rhamnosyltransferase